MTMPSLPPASIAFIVDALVYFDSGDLQVLLLRFAGELQRRGFRVDLGVSPPPPKDPP